MADSPPMQQPPNIPDNVKGKIWLIVVSAIASVLVLTVLFIGFTKEPNQNLYGLATSSMAFLMGLLLPSPLK